MVLVLWMPPIGWRSRRVDISRGELGSWVRQGGGAWGLCHARARRVTAKAVSSGRDHAGHDEARGVGGDRGATYLEPSRDRTSMPENSVGAVE